MNKISHKDYEAVIEHVFNFINKFPKHLTPKYIIQNGEINNPGISDIDLMIGFEDDFIFSSQFLYLFNKEIKILENKEVFFHHLPNIFPSSSLKLLPSMTYNPAGKLKFIKGKIDFEESIFNEYQNILNTFEQIHSRISMLVKLLFKKEIKINALLLIGHSLSHTINCINQIGGQFNFKEFINFIKIEEIRKKITEDNENYSYEYESLCKGLINEFFLILRWVNEYFDKKINIHFSKSNNVHHYDDRIFLTNLDVNLASPKYSLDNNNFLIDGFSWQSKCIFENYFENNQNYKTLFLDIKLEKEISRRMNFIKSITNFNFKNFNNAEGRSSLHPLVKNNRYSQIAHDL